MSIINYKIFTAPDKRRRRFRTMLLLMERMSKNGIDIKFTICDNIYMNIAIYILSALTMVAGTATAVLYQTRRNVGALIAKMLAAVLFVIAGIIAFSVRSASETMCALILAGLFPALGGDWFLAVKEISPDEKRDYRNFALGVICFGVAQILYLLAFLADAEFRFMPAFIPLIVLPLLCTLISLLTKQIYIEKKRLPFVVCYGLLLGTTLAMAASRYYLNPTTGGLIAMIGAAAFVLSDMSLACFFFADKIKDRRFFNFPVMILYFGAQVLYVLAMIF